MWGVHACTRAHGKSQSHTLTLCSTPVLLPYRFAECLSSQTVQGKLSPPTATASPTLLFLPPSSSCYSSSTSSSSWIHLSSFRMTKINHFILSGWLPIKNGDSNRNEIHISLSWSPPMIDLCGHKRVEVRFLKSKWKCLYDMSSNHPHCADTTLLITLLSSPSECIASRRLRWANRVVWNQAMSHFFKRIQHLVKRLMSLRGEKHVCLI